jgi:hypothetical protein
MLFIVDSSAAYSCGRLASWSGYEATDVKEAVFVYLQAE